MATPAPFAKSAKSKTPVSAKQAAGLANFLKGKKAPVMDAEDKIDGGSDEDKEK